MSLRVAVAAPFKEKGKDRVTEQAFVVALSLDRDWVSPDQAKRLVDIATTEGLLDREDGELVATFDYDQVTIPEDFVPSESMFHERSAFERVLDALEAAGTERQEVVAAINTYQQEIGVNADTAAVLFARKEGVDVADAAEKATQALRP